MGGFYPLCIFFENLKSFPIFRTSSFTENARYLISRKTCWASFRAIFFTKASGHPEAEPDFGLKKLRLWGARFGQKRISLAKKRFVSERKFGENGDGGVSRVESLRVERRQREVVTTYVLQTDSKRIILNQDVADF
jgi:hypothetical protein